VRLLLVESDASAAGRVAAELCDHGFTVDVVATGAALLDVPTLPDLVLLSLDLPDLDGLEVCRRLRTRSDVPVIALSGRDSELERVLGFQAGLDDYVTRPCRARELAARIGAVMRRVRRQARAAGQESGSRRTVITHGPLRISLRTREVRVGDRSIAVTPKEFDLLALLASEPDTVFSRRHIMSTVWDDPTGNGSRTIDTHVGALRAKLGSRSWVVNVRGVGFRLGHV
jgi:DNA-binding response OmpR family regulator